MELMMNNKSSIDWNNTIITPLIKLLGKVDQAYVLYAILFSGLFAYLTTRLIVEINNNIAFELMNRGPHNLCLFITLLILINGLCIILPSIFNWVLYAYCKWIINKYDNMYDFLTSYIYCSHINYNPSPLL